MKQLQQTNVVVTFQFTTDKEAELTTLLQLGFSLAMMTYWFIQTTYRFGYELVVLTDDLWQALNFVGKVYSIGFNSLRWGIGL